MTNAQTKLASLTEDDKFDLAMDLSLVAATAAEKVSGNSGEFDLYHDAILAALVKVIDEQL